MVKVIIGNKGSGKTKYLVELVNAAVEASSGNVVCIEKKPKLTYEVSSRARLVQTDDYGISGYDQLYGFIAGIMARDYDSTEIFLDSTKKIGGDDPEALAAFLEKMSALSDRNGITLVMTASFDRVDVPESVGKFIIN